MHVHAFMYLRAAAGRRNRVLERTLNRQHTSWTLLYITQTAESIVCLKFSGMTSFLILILTNEL